MVITITPLGGYAQTIGFSCAPYPAVVPPNLTCTFSPAAVNFYTGTGSTTLAQTTTLTITSGSVAAMLKEQHPRGSSKNGIVMAALFMGLVAGIFPLFSRRRKGIIWKRFSRMAVLLLAMGAVACLSGCGNSQVSATAPPGTYDISVAFNDGSPVTHYLTLTVTVQ
jgi:hypothetical protein